MKGTRGFTLIEVILAVVLGGLLLGMLLPYLGNVMAQRGQSALRLSASCELQDAMGRIWGDYAQRKDTEVLLDKINNNLYGNYSIQQNSYIEFDSSLHEVASSSMGNPPVFLKVTISNPNGEAFTSLFPKP